MNNDDLCPMSDLPPDQCALPCHLNESLPKGADPSVIRGDVPFGFRVWPPPAREAHEARDTRPRPKRPKPLEPCMWDRAAEVWVTREHVRDCDDRACKGCKPCGAEHCAMRGRCPNHVDPEVGIRTCPQCMGAFRADVAEVETLTTLVWDELQHASIDSEIVNLAGPVAAPEQFDARREAIFRADDARGWCDLPRRAEDDDDLHPTSVLTRWEWRLRETYGPPATLFPTVSSAAAYIVGLLDQTSFPHDDVFEDVAGDITRVRTHIENALSDSRQPDQGAPCPACAVEIQKPPRLELKPAHWCDNPECRREHVSTYTDPRTGETHPDTRKDEWVCPVNPSHRWQEADYRLRVSKEYLEGARALTASQMQDQWGIAPGTLRRWANGWKDHDDNPVPPCVARRGKDSQGRQLYDVAEARAAHARGKPAGRVS